MKVGEMVGLNSIGVKSEIDAAMGRIKKKSMKNLWILTIQPLTVNARILDRQQMEVRRNVSL